MQETSSTLGQLRTNSKMAPNKFKIDLMCSQRHGIYGELPVGMNHLYKNDAGHKVVANISVQQLMNKTSSAKQFPDILKNQIKTYWDKMHHKNINQIVMEQLQ